MSELITSDALLEQISELGGYASWQAAAGEASARKKELPKQLDLNNRNHLEAQMLVVDADGLEVAARQEFIAEVAGQGDEFLPVVYRLGMVAVFDKLKHFKEESFWLGRPLVPRKEDQISPAKDPVVRATQVAEELLSLLTKLEQPGPIPVAMVENEYCSNCRVEYNLVAGGVLTVPESALAIEAPAVLTEDGERKVTYEVPTVLKGVTEVKGYAGHRAGGFYRAEPNRYSVGPAEPGVVNPPIPRLIALVGAGRSFTSIDALYVGDSAKARIDTAVRHEQYLTTPRPERSSRSRRRRRW